jgi:hypothetical protein
MSPALRHSPEPPDQDTRLAELLDACLQAERGAPGSAAEIVRQAPQELREELEQLMAVARALATAEWTAPSSEFRASARARLEAAAQPAPRAIGSGVGRRRVARWLVGLAAGLALLALGGYGSVLASVGSLPGEPLYAVKQADEAITLGLTRDDLSRALVLLRQAGIRLDEARRLVAAGRVETAGELLQQYASTLERAGAALNRATAADPRARAEFQSQLQQQLGQLQSLGSSAPPPLQSSIERAEGAVSQQLAQGEDQTGSQGAGQTGSQGAGQTGGQGAAPTPVPSPVSPAVSPSPAASPSVRPPAPAHASPSPASSSTGEDTPGK